MSNLNINFCGFNMDNPFILAASPISATGEMIRRAFDSGWGGAVYKTIARDGDLINPKVNPRYQQFQYEDKKFFGFENIDLGNDQTLKESLRDISRLKKKYPGNLLIVSIRGGLNELAWKDLAIKAQEAGADMIELMFSCPHGAKGIADDIDPGQPPDLTERIAHWVKEVVNIKIMVKMSPNVTDIRIPARAAKIGGADAISATNTIKCIAGIDLDRLVPLPDVDGYSCQGGLSGPAIKPIILKFIADIAMDKKINLPVSAIGGVSSWKDATEYILLGASTVQVATAVMRYGFRIIEDLKDGLLDFMIEKGFEKIDDFVGLALKKLVIHEQLNRNIKVLSSINVDLCAKCDLCYIACRDGAYQVIELDKNRIPRVDEEKCKGCSLCQQVCPVWGCITMKLERTK